MSTPASIIILVQICMPKLKFLNFKFFIHAHASKWVFTIKMKTPLTNHFQSTPKHNTAIILIKLNVK